MANFHDSYLLLPQKRQNLSSSTSAGASGSSAGLTTQTYWVQLCAPGVVSASGGVRVEISPAPTANTSSSFLPFDWIQTVKCSPGDRVAAVSNDSVAETLTVTELSGG